MQGYVHEEGSTASIAFKNEEREPSLFNPIVKIQCLVLRFLSDLQLEFYEVFE
jgi:hypothetical protein